jgi:hypothetical protein
LLHVPVPQTRTAVPFGACGAVTFRVNTNVTAEYEFVDLLVSFALVTVHDWPDIGPKSQVSSVTRLGVAVHCWVVSHSVSEVTHSRRNMAEVI